MAKVVVSDPLPEEGYQMLGQRRHEALDVTGLAGGARAAAVADAEAWIIRSGTRLGAAEFALAPRLRAVGRAGVGVDNVDLDAATQAGVAVFNAPTGNITSAAEQAWALMLAVARHVPAADAGMKRQEWLRKELKGTELAGKTIFIVGLGRIGRMMAKRAQAFEMETIGYDPYVTAEAARSFGVEAVDMATGFSRADFVTLHTPLTAQTRDLVDASLLARAKPGQILVNAARGGLVDEAALLAALDDGRLRGAGIDVWAGEPPQDWSLARHPGVVAAPHLGASTAEAQVKAALQAIERVCDFLDTGDAGLALNAQATVPDRLRPWAQLAEALAGFAVQCLRGPVRQVTVAATEGIEAKPLSVHALVGALRVNLDVPVNAINAPGLASERGWTVAHRNLLEGPPFLRVEVASEAHTVVIEGTFTQHYGSRVTMLDGYDVEFRPTGRFLLTRHQDVPGVLASTTAILADANVNVASVSLARKGDHTALAVIKVDGSIPRSARDALRGLEAIDEAHRVRL